MKRAYSTFIAMCGQDSLVYVPDMDIYTSGILTMVDVDFQSTEDEMITEWCAEM